MHHFLYFPPQGKTPDFYQRIVSARFFVIPPTSALPSSHLNQQLCSPLAVGADLFSSHIHSCHLSSPPVDDLYPAGHHEAQSEVVCVHWRVSWSFIFPVCWYICICQNQNQKCFINVLYIWCAACSYIRTNSHLRLVALKSECVKMTKTGSSPSKLGDFLMLDRSESCDNQFVTLTKKYDSSRLSNPWILLFKK